MPDVRVQAREAVHTLVTAWLAGDRDGVTVVLAPTVRWWTPLSDESSEGPAGAWSSLEAVLARIPRPIEIDALLVNEDGTRGVVELRAPAPDQAAVLVTSVVTLSDGSIVEGSTYTDVGAATAMASR